MKRTCPALGTDLLPVTGTPQLQQQQHFTGWQSRGSPADVSIGELVTPWDRARQRGREEDSAQQPPLQAGESMVASAFCSQELRMSLCCLPQLLRMGRQEVRPPALSPRDHLLLGI